MLSNMPIQTEIKIDTFNKCLKKYLVFEQNY